MNEIKVDSGKALRNKVAFEMLAKAMMYLLEEQRKAKANKLVAITEFKNIAEKIKPVGDNDPSGMLVIDTLNLLTHRMDFEQAAMGEVILTLQDFRYLAAAGEFID